MQVALILEDQTIENGCTLLPGSHKWDHYADNLAYNTSWYQSKVKLAILLFGIAVFTTVHSKTLRPLLDGQ